MIENISSDKTLLQSRFVLQNKDLKSKVRKINLKWILLNQLKWILDELFRILQDNISPHSLNLGQTFHGPRKPPFSWFGKACLICLSLQAFYKMWLFLKQETDGSLWNRKVIKSGYYITFSEENGKLYQENK